MINTVNHRNLPLLLLKAREALLGKFRIILNHYGLTEQQWRIMRHLFEKGTTEPNELCQSCQILSPSMVGVLGRMQVLGLIKSKRSRQDQRRKNISLTKAGEDLCTQIMPLIEEQYSLIADTIGAELLDATYQQIDLLLSASIDEIPNIKLPPIKEAIES